MEVSVNVAFWFMVVQSVTCFGGAVGFYIYKRDYAMAWVWANYASANIGFAIIALR
jgi:hypothetical protein